jgi:hypothetical protein
MSLPLFKLLEKGTWKLTLTLGTNPLFRPIEVYFLIMHCTSAYNVILSQTFLNVFGALVSTTHLAKNFPTYKRSSGERRSRHGL